MRTHAAYFTAVAFALALIVVAGAKGQQPIPAGFRESPLLEVVASYVAGRPAQVFCATSAEAWRSAVAAQQFTVPDVKDPYGFAWATEAVVFLPDYGCSFIERPAPVTKRLAPFAADLMTLVHESVHAGGQVDELITQCLARKRVAEVAIKFYGFKAHTDRIRELVRLAYALRYHPFAPYC